MASNIYIILYSITFVRVIYSPYYAHNLALSNPLALATGSRTITSNRAVHNNSSLSFPFALVDMTSLDRNYITNHSLTELSLIIIIIIIKK